MKCPKCGVNDQQFVISTRRRSTDYISRRRECLSCGHRFTSIEVVELTDDAIRAIRTTMKKNCAPRTFERILDHTWRKVFETKGHMNDATGID